MSSTAKMWIAIVVVIILAVVGWLLWGSSNAPVSPQTPETVGANVTDQNAQSASNIDNGPALTTSPTDTSDAAINNDLSTIDAQMTNLNSDTQSANVSVSGAGTQ